MRMRYNNLMQTKSMTNPLQNMQSNYLKIDGYIKQMENAINIKQKELEKIFQANVGKLDALSPLKTLTRGYVIVEKNDKITKSSEDLDIGDQVELKFIDGSKTAKII